MLLQTPDGAPAPLPLAGVRVLDLSRFGPGPFCAALLADLGADVVVLERTRSEDIRLRTSVAELTGTNLWLQDVRRRTRRVGVDLKAANGHDVLRRLTEGAQVVIEGFRPGVAAKLRADYATLSEIRPDLVYCSISGYGQTGPYRERPGHDINYIAEAGLLGLSGRPGGPPGLPGSAIADFAAGSLYAASGILAALVDRERSGRGSYIDVSMQEAVVQVMARFIVPFLEAGTVFERGNSYLTGANAWYGVHTTSDDRHLAVGAVEDSFFRRLSELVGRPQWEYARGDANGEARLHDEMAALLSERTRDEWVELLGDAACVSPVLSIPEVADDPQLTHRNVFVTVEEDGQPQRVLGAMARGANPRPDRPRPAAPAAGETDSILSDAGLSPLEIQELRDSGVVA